MNTEQAKNKELFEEMRVPRAVAAMAVPTIMSQLIILIYNMADTFFIGRTNNPYMVAASSLVLTVFLMVGALSNLFGVGGGSLMVRLLGAKDPEEARNAAAWTLVAGGAAALGFSLFCLVFMDPMLRLLGASDNTIGYARQYLTFVVVGAWLQDLLAMGVEWLTGAVDAALTAGHVNEMIHGVIINGIFEGVGSVLSFLPIIVTMFFFLSLLEDSGYLARVAFFMDRLLRQIGLSGRSIVPMLIGFGCTVPAVMSTRTLPSERDRKMTILLTPFMSCTAKLPIYAFFVSAFFPKQGWLVMTGLYVLGIAVSILVALLFKKTLFRGEAVPFVMELPNYRMPSPRSVLQLLWEKAKDFLQRAFSVILIATIVVWFLQSFTFSLNFAQSSHDSILAAISGLFVPLFRPVGLGDWRIVTSLVSGFMAKESVVSVLEVLFGTEGGVSAVMNSLTAASLLVFSLLYTPCVASIAAIRRELGGRWAVNVVIWQCAIAWLGALAVRLIGMAFGMG